MPIQFTTGAGRIVWGNPLIAKPKTDDNKKPVLDPQTGQPIMQYAFGFAIPKHEFGFVQGQQPFGLWAAMLAEATATFGQGVPANFAWKIKDGDGLDDQGKPYNTREGYAGCYVLTVSTESFRPRVVRLNGGAYQEMTDGIKTGDYGRVALTLKGHTGKQGTRGSKPGLYVNPQMFEFLGYGEAIQNGPDAMTVFGGQVVALPPGASAVPLAPSGGMPGAPGMPGVHPMQPGQPQYAAAAAPGAAHPGTAPAGFQGAPVTQGTAYPSNTAPATPAHDFVYRAAQGMPDQPGGAPQYAAASGMPGYNPMPGAQPQ